MSIQTGQCHGLRTAFINTPPEFESLKTAKARNEDLIRGLSRLEDSAALALSMKLQECTEGARCASHACSVCNRLFRRQLYREVLRTLPPAFEVARLSLIPAAFRVEIGALAKLDLLKWVSSRHRALERALPAEALFVGGVDISYNTFENGGHHWSLHLYGFLLLPIGWGVSSRYRRGRLRAEIERRCPPIPKAARVGGERPMMLKPCSADVFVDNLLYAHKATFYGRSRYTYTRRTTGNRSTNVQPEEIPRPASLELSMFLDRSPLGSRLIIIGYRRRGRRFDRFTLCRERDLPVVTK